MSNQLLRDRDGNEIGTGFYYDVLSSDPELRYLVFVVRDGQEITFDSYYPSRISNLSQETQARRIIPLFKARKLKNYSELETLLEDRKTQKWMGERVSEYLATH